MVKKHLLLQSTVLINKQNTWILYLSKGGPGLLATYISFFLLFDGGSIIQKILLRNWLTDIQKAVNRSWEAANWFTHSYEKKKKKWKQVKTTCKSNTRKGQRNLFYQWWLFFKENLSWMFFIFLSWTIFLLHIIAIKFYNGFQMCQCLKKCFRLLNIHATREPND